MRNKWLKFSCLLTGYNYSLIVESSEDSHRILRKYTSAILLVTAVWGLVGYIFTTMFLDANYIFGIFGSIFSMFIVIQIERQIILGKRNRWAGLFRFFIGISIAILGSLITDQAIFAKDIESIKRKKVDEYIKPLVDSSQAQLKINLTYNDNLVKYYENKINEYEQLPDFIVKDTRNEKTISDSSGRITGKIRETENEAVRNSLKDQIPSFQSKLSELQLKNDALLDSAANIYSQEKDAFLNDTGFLIEMDIFFDEILKVKENWPMLFVWLLFFFILLFIEMFVLVNKWSEKEGDYERLVEFQKEIRVQQLDNLKQKVL